MILVVLFIPDLFVHDWEESAPYEWKAEIIVVADVYWCLLGTRQCSGVSHIGTQLIHPITL